VSSRVLDTWKSTALERLTEDGADDGSSTDKLIRFGQMVQNDAADPALRSWAQAEPSVAKTLAEVDRARMTRLEALMGDIGISNDDFSKAAYGALIGLKQTHLDDGDGLVAFAALIDLVLALK
ncbi:MAG: hypothetical protein AAFY39_15165, partial [Pseudomonadota bacterium]